MKFKVMFIRAGARKCSPKFPIPITYSWKNLIDGFQMCIEREFIIKIRMRKSVSYTKLTVDIPSKSYVRPDPHKHINIWLLSTFYFSDLYLFRITWYVWMVNVLQRMKWNKYSTAFTCNLTEFFILYFINETIYSWSEMFGDLWYILQYWYLGKMKRYWCFSFHTLINISFDYDVFIFIFDI